MTLHLFTDEEKLAEIDRIIRSMKEFKLKFSERRQIDIMISIAKDMRAKQPEAPSQALTEIERSLVAVERSKTRLGYDERTLIHLANDVIGYWPTLRAALLNQGRES